MHKTNNFIKYSYLEKISWRKELREAPIGMWNCDSSKGIDWQTATGSYPVFGIYRDLYMELNSFLLLSLFTPILSYYTLLTIYSGIYRKMNTTEP